MHDLDAIAQIRNAQSRSISAENPTGAKGTGAQASPGDDEHCTDAAKDLGKGWKVRPCLRNIEPGQTVVLADIEGPGVVRHIWCTVLESVHRWLALRVYYDDASEASIETPLGDFFANGLDGRALINSIPVTVAPKGGMNSYWPMPFRKRVRIEVTNEGPERVNELFFQIDYTLEDVPGDAGLLHAAWRRATTPRDKPEHVIHEGIRGRGHYVGTYLVWAQLSSGWWGEGEVKFFIDGDAHDSPTICGTGTEDYFGGAWGFVMDHERDMRPRAYSAPYLGLPASRVHEREEVRASPAAACALPLAPAGSGSLLERPACDGAGDRVVAGWGVPAFGRRHRVDGTVVSGPRGRARAGWPPIERAVRRGKIVPCVARPTRTCFIAFPLTILFVFTLLPTILGPGAELVLVGGPCGVRFVRLRGTSRRCWPTTRSRRR